MGNVSRGKLSLSDSVPSPGRPDEAWSGCKMGMPGREWEVRRWVSGESEHQASLGVLRPVSKLMEWRPGEGRGMAWANLWQHCLWRTGELVTPAKDTEKVLGGQGSSLGC